MAGEGEKLSHAAVDYGRARGPRECWRCEHYQGKNESDDGKPACELVQRPIAPSSWCKKFEDAFREL